MREYEIVYIFRSNFTPEEIEAKLERYHGILTSDGSGEITAVEQWGKRQLAYPISKQPNGYYVVAQFTADPATLPALERVLTLEEDLLRYLIVLSEGELPIPGSMHSVMDDRVGPGTPSAQAAARAGSEGPTGSEAATPDAATPDAATADAATADADVEVDAASSDDAATEDDEVPADEAEEAEPADEAEESEGDEQADTADEKEE